MRKEVERIAQELRYDPFHLLWNNCIIKSLRLKKKCQALGIPVEVEVCLGKVRFNWLGRWFTSLTVHGYGKIRGEKIEVAHPLDRIGPFGVVDADIVPVFTVLL